MGWWYYGYWLYSVHRKSQEKEATLKTVYDRNLDWKVQKVCGKDLPECRFRVEDWGWFCVRWFVCYYQCQWLLWNLARHLFTSCCSFSKFYLFQTMGTDYQDYFWTNQQLFWPHIQFISCWDVGTFDCSLQFLWLFHACDPETDPKILAFPSLSQTWACMCTRGCQGIFGQKWRPSADATTMPMDTRHFLFVILPELPTKDGSNIQVQMLNLGMCELLSLTLEVQYYKCYGWSMVNLQTSSFSSLLSLSSLYRLDVFMAIMIRMSTSSGVLSHSLWLCAKVIFLPWMISPGDSFMFLSFALLSVCVCVLPGFVLVTLVQMSWDSKKR